MAQDERRSRSIFFRARAIHAPSLFWISRCCRYDIAVALTILSRASANPEPKHWTALLRVLQYLANTPTRGVVIRPSKDPYNATLLTYTDASYASDPSTGRSISGQIVTVDNTVLDWTSKHQPYVTLSSGDSETVAAASAATQAEYWSQLFEHAFGSRPKSLIATDSTTARNLLTNPMHTTVMKHIRTKMLYVRELIGAHRHQLFHIPGKDNPADMMTKPLDGRTIRHLKRPLRSWGGEVAREDANTAKRNSTTSTLAPTPKRFRTANGGH